MTADLRARAAELLASLGDDPDAVYGALMGRGIVGQRDEGCTCPIANLIRAEVAEADDDGMWLTPWDLGKVDGWFVLRDSVYTPDGRIVTPAPIAEFIRRFDEGNGVRDGEIFYPYEDMVG